MIMRCYCIKKLPYAELEFINHTKHQIPTKAANDLNEMIRQFLEGACEPHSPNQDLEGASIDLNTPYKQ